MLDLHMDGVIYQKEQKMSSGKLKRHDGFNPVQIKDGKVVRVNKNGTIKEVMGTIKEMKEKNDK